MRLFLRLSASLLLCLLMMPIGGAHEASVMDLDVGVPPGTPLDWFSQHREPVPTGGRGAVPTGMTKEERQQKAEAEKNEAKKGMTVTEKPKIPFHFTHEIPNLYEYFGVTTKDIMAHVSLPGRRKPDKKKVKQKGKDVPTGEGGAEEEYELEFLYPPELPLEMAWMAVMVNLRVQCHPEVVSNLESCAYLLRLGIPGTFKMKGVVVPDFPPGPPQIPTAKDKFDQMVCRLAAVELVSGYPYTLDPNYARRILGLGGEAYDAIVICTKSKHSFLQQNAVAILANFRVPGATQELRKQFRTCKNAVSRIRAMTALIQRRDLGIVPDLIKMAVNERSDAQVMRAYAIWGLGMIGDKRGAKPLSDMLGGRVLPSPDIQWAILPALGRIADRSKSTIRTLKTYETKVWNDIGQDDHVTSTQQDGSSGTIKVEDPGSRFKILRQMAMMALAANGEKKYVDEFIRRMGSPGHTDFHQAVWFILVDMLGKVDPEGTDQLKRLVDGARLEQMQALALRWLVNEKKVDAEYIRGQCSGGSAMVRGLALQLLAELDEKMAAEECKEIVDRYSGGRVDAGEAYVVATAANVGGKLDVDWGKSIVSAAEGAYESKAYAKRVSNENPDIAQFQVSTYPPLMESLMAEVGRPRLKEAVPFLIRVLDGDSTPGRAEAAFSLGNIGGKEAVERLLNALDDRAGWVRFAAYRALRSISGEDYFCDWIFSSKSRRRKYVEKYRDWFLQNPQK
ncbi:MAG: HEAT repeat domain-containing protein [Planctomycetota bacterium]|jgi:HEAT repeat protein